MITQPDHAHLSWALARLWRTDGIPEHPRRDDLLRAIREHDNGWWESDAAPTLDGERDRPHDFLSLPRDERCRIWRRGVERIAADRPYGALLVALHGLALHASAGDEPAVCELIEYLEERRDQLAEGAGIDLDTARGDYRWLAVCDHLSLVACNSWTRAFDLAVSGRVPLSGELEGSTLRLTPFPLAGATTLSVLCRRIPRRTYEGDLDLAMELARARFERLSVRLEAV